MQLCLLLILYQILFHSLSPLQGLGTDDRALIRIMVSRSEIDLFNIRKEFKETHDASLHEFIQVEAFVVSPCLIVSRHRPWCMTWYAICSLDALYNLHCDVCCTRYYPSCVITHPLLLGLERKSSSDMLLWGRIQHSCLGISPACMTSSVWPPLRMIRPLVYVTGNVQ